MKHLLSLLLLSVCFIGIRQSFAQLQGYSAYTNLNKCEFVPTEASELYTERCQSLDKNYTVIQHAYEFQIWLKLMHQDASLAYQTTFRPMNLGEKLEWRYHLKDKQKQYYALIYRVNEYDDVNPTILMRPPTISNLLVIKLYKEKSCIIGKVDAHQNNANQIARQIADHSLTQKMPCLQTMAKPEPSREY
ncbi:hypothetical protein [Moraxella boevrei]|uniref:hypothetical protein n=1 Tax=Faucicola boevrei TaxID=346665 RepID=UPI0037351CE7